MARSLSRCLVGVSSDSYSVPPMLARTHHLGALRKSDVGQSVVLQGWVHRRRDHGGVIFLDLRDREGLTQVVLSPEHGAEAHELAHDVRSEYCLQVIGEVRPRDAEAVNPKLPTGEIEVYAKEIVIFSKSLPPPISIAEDKDEDERLRLQYRYLDLRKPDNMDVLRKRHRFLSTVRQTLDLEGFVEVETPILSKSTPEGARDFLVPSRLNAGAFYALPQSPQLFKQILMVSGLEKYLQITKCFRDEDLRQDRQPEFTQIDVEMSFVDPDMVMAMTERFMSAAAMAAFGIELKAPYPRMTYQHAMDKYGVDAPDLRFGLELVNLSEVFKDTAFQQFRKQLDAGGLIKAIRAEKSENFSRKVMDELTEFVKRYGAKGLAWFVVEENELRSPVTKFLSEAEIKGLRETTGAKPGDVLFLLCDKASVVNEALGRLRIEIAKRENLIKPGFVYTWVVDFPLLAWSEEEKRYDAVHHPFTAPLPEDLHLLESDPLAVRSQAYDLVLNGNEIGGGSIRIHDPETQRKIFSLLNISSEEAESRFGFLLSALSYGAPPHGGIAMGVDRVIMHMAGRQSIRDTIAFPKTQSGTCLMSDAPGPVSKKQLDDVFIKVAEPPPTTPKPVT